MSLKILTAEALAFFPESEFQIWQQPSWSQNSQGYRESIRQFALSMPGLSAEKDLILDLDKPLVKVPCLNSMLPQNFDSIYFSISHSTNSGALAQSLIPVGIDLELESRVSEKIVARVSSAAELQEAPSAAYLWSAKEACFKTLVHFRQPQTVSQIEISEWSKLSSGAYSFGLKHKNNFLVSHCKGFVLSHHSEALAVFFAKP